MCGMWRKSYKHNTIFLMKCQSFSWNMTNVRVHEHNHWVLRRNAPSKMLQKSHKISLLVKPFSDTITTVSFGAALQNSSFLLWSLKIINVGPTFSAALSVNRQWLSLSFLCCHLLVSSFQTFWGYHFCWFCYEAETSLIKIPQRMWFVCQTTFFYDILKRILKICQVFFCQRCSSVHRQIFWKPHC
jgi:hypothetical protein